MAMWTKVLSGFDSEDETVNIGARTVAENDGAIYEACTRATIQPDNKNDIMDSPSDNKNDIINNPRVIASFWHSMMCIAVDKTITIFSDESCQDIITILGFESIVTAYCLSSDGQFIYVGIENGELHAFNLSMGGRQIFNIDFIDKYQSEYIIQLVLHETHENNDLTIITKDGKMFKIINIDNNYLNDQSINDDDDHHHEIDIKFICGLSKLNGAISRNNHSTDNYLNITFGDKLTILPKNITSNTSNLNYKFKKIQFFNNYQSAICLRMDGSLNILCLQTLLSRKIWKNCIDDFISIKEDLEGPYHMLILMKPDDITNKKKLHLLSFPDFKIKFTIVVENTTYLVDIINNKTDNENLLFLEGIKTTNEYVDLIRIKAIEESIPELRLQRLLRKYKFNEALDFALKFNLDCEIVYHAEAMMLMEKLRPRLQSSEKIDVDIFMTTLDKIKDVKFIYECCNNAMTKDYKDTRKLLVYSRQRIVDYVNDKNIQDKLNENLSQLLATVSDTLRKLETFEMIHKADVINETSTDEWIKFSRENLLKECMEYLSNSELNSASLIWTRHMSSIASIVTSETIIDILAAIPENLSPDELWPWLIHFIPSVTSLIPNGLSEIINWGYKKTKTLEKYHRDLWPDIGLEFANGFINILQFEENNIYYQFHQEYTNKNSQLQRLMLLIQAMKDLRDLKTNYKIFLPLHTYLGNSTDVIHLLLNKVNINELPNLLDNFLHVYMLNNSLKNDHVLSSYVQNILKNSKGWWLWEKAPWDKRLSIVINYIHNIQNRLQQTLEVLKRAPVPWSDEVKLLAEKSYNYDHPLVAKIRIESNSVVVKLILKKYRYAHIGLSSRFFSYIIKQNRSTMIDDIIELTKMNNTTRFNVFSECVNYHLTQGNIDLSINIIDSLSKSLKKMSSKNIAYCKLNELENGLLCNLQIDAYNEAVGQLVDDDDYDEEEEKEKQENLQLTTTTKNWYLYKIYKDASISPGNILLPLLSDLFIIIKHYKNKIDYNLQYSINEINIIKDLSKKISINAQAIQNEHHDFALLKIITNISIILSSLVPSIDDIIQDIHDVLNHCVIMMLKKVIVSINFDVQLGLVCLLMIPHDNSLKTLGLISKLHQADYKRDRIIKDLGYEYCRLTKNYQQMEEFNMMKIRYEWAKRLANYKITYREIMSNDVDIKHDILRRIMSSNENNIIDTLNDYCLSFGFVRDDVYLAYLESLLCSWEPKYIINNQNGQKEPIIDDNDVKNLTYQCKKIVNKLTTEIDIKKFFFDILKKINYYHYEIFLIIYDLSDEKKIDTTSYLLFLKSYIRISEPTKIEIDEWSNFNQENQPLPKISKWRLPYLPKLPHFKLIQSEINLKNYDKWLTISRVLNIPDYNICSVAIKAGVDGASKTIDINNINTWSIYPRNSGLLKDIKKCINCMKIPESYTHATAALYYAVNYMPPGADQVEAAKECFSYINNLPEGTIDIDNDKRIKIENKYRKYTSKHILHTYGLGDDKYLNLVDYPEQLVRALYYDKTIPERYRCATKNRPDINSSVNDLGKVFNINLVKIRLELLEEWLQPDTGEIKNDSITVAGICQDDTSSSLIDTFTFDDNLLRACYIISCGDHEQFIGHLITMGLTEDFHCPGVRYRALRVVQSITDENTIQELSKINSTTMNEYLKSLQYLTDLQRLGIGYSISGFDSCSKEKLIQVLISNQYCCSRSLRLVPQLFIDYHIDNYELLNLTLLKMVKLSLIKELKKTLIMIGTTMDRIVNYSGYIDAWQIIISESFNKIDSKYQQNLIDSCIETLRLLHTCPVVNKLKFFDIIHSCFRAQQPHFAAALLPFVEDTDKQLILNEISLNYHDIDSVIKKLKDLEKKGILIVRQSIMMLEKAHYSSATGFQESS
ncbi:kinetochore-associated protein 1-like [Aphidius gifuensis]|uniref:kinetochore-associated protein 1-like n=1 Tax=Aphidius gifuensis TaxID=684658 RepID=UPI001CDD8A57|nr:kinetochore-associated protein 1-like [Aphidius gifuensis]